jgi:ribonuclease HIII
VRIIGVDESGKGDFFGPLVIAALLASDADSEKLRSIGAKDSKTVTNTRVLVIDEVLRDSFPHAVIVINPAEYNTRYEKIKNLNKLLAAGHADAIAQVLADETADLAISDRFGKPELIDGELAKRKLNIHLKQITGGESIVQVAAASILARAEFIRSMDRLSAKFGMELPKGAAGHVDAAGRAFVRRHGAAELRQVAKLHFKNYTRVVTPRLGAC